MLDVKNIFDFVLQTRFISFIAKGKFLIGICSMAESDTTPSTDRRPLFQATKFTSADDVGLWDQGGGTFKSVTNQGRPGGIL